MTTLNIGRCFGDNDPLYADYHDNEWGRRVTGDTAIFERMVLEGFQSGLSWLTILRKRDNFRAAFAGFEPQAVAQFGDDDRERLLADAGIVRNRLKIDAAIANAQAVCSMQERGESLTELVWSFEPTSHVVASTFEELPAKTPESVALTKALKARGFRFVGPTTMYALMQACGIVNDHLAQCPARTS